jgi:hypothetical protein
VQKRVPIGGAPPPADSLSFVQGLLQYDASSVIFFQLAVLFIGEHYTNCYTVLYNVI